MANVHVRPSSLQEYAVARSFSKPISAVVVRSVDWISGSCTCSPQPQETNGSKPAAGSLLTGMDTVTWEARSSPFEALPASELPVFELLAQALSTPPKPTAAALTPATRKNVRLEKLFIVMSFHRPIRAHSCSVLSAHLLSVTGYKSVTHYSRQNGFSVLR